MRRGATLAGLLLLSAFVPTAGAQDAGTGVEASTYLPADHWAAAAVRRMQGLGLAPDWVEPGRRTWRWAEARVVLAAAARAAPRGSDVQRLAAAYVARLAEEYGAVRGERPGEWRGSAALPRRVAGAAAFGWVQRADSVLPGIGYEPNDWTGPRPVEDAGGGRATARAVAEWTPYLAVGVAGEAADGTAVVREAYAVGAAPGAGVWLGRRAVGYGPGAGGGLVLDGRVAFDGGGVFTTVPLLLPGPLRHIGPLHLETFLSRLDRNGRIDSPWLWGARASARPHPRLQVGATRAAMFGNGAINFRNIAYLLIGKHAGRVKSVFENQVAAVDVWYRPPVPALPVAVYAEWGMDDSAGAWLQVPAILVGFELPALPFAPAVTAGIEYTTIPPRTSGHPMWYRHWVFKEGWAVDGTPLAHPLGGHGREWRAHGRADLLAARLRVELELFHRWRGEENLFAADPTAPASSLGREGRSVGGSLGAEWRLGGFAEVTARARIEDGAAGWREGGGFLGVRVVF